MNSSTNSNGNNTNIENRDSSSDYNTANCESDFVSRLRVALGKNRGRKFAESAGLSYSTLHNYLKGISLPTLDNLIKLAQATQVSVEWLSTGHEYSPYATRTFVKDELMLVPSYAAIPEGHQVAISRQWLTERHLQDQDLVSFTVYGDSMAPTLEQYDHVVINTAIDAYKDGMLLLVEYNDVPLIKRVQTNFNTLLLISDNSRYQTIEVPNFKKSGLSIIGQVVYITKNVI